MACLAADPNTVTLQGKLLVEAKATYLETATHERVELSGDEPTTKVLRDSRLNGFDVQAKGHYTGAQRFAVDPMHTRAVMVRKEGGLKMVTYWCDVCSIRSYTPGPCVCCQQETTLDLRDPHDIDHE